MSTAPSTDCTVAKYLALRLHQLDVKHLFGVPGNHLGPFLSATREVTEIQWVGNTNELNGGYAADGYARVRGLAAVGVTYGVGALGLISTVGGAFVEKVPLVVINASPTYEQWLNYESIGLLTSHMSPNRRSNLDAYRQVTVDAQMITNAELAPSQIDCALLACLSEQRPVYLEVMENVWTTRCAPPVGQLSPRHRPFTPRNEEMLEKAVSATVALVKAHGRPILWGGEELQQNRLQDEFQRLVEETRLPFCTTIMGKSLLSERHPLFHGVYNGKASLPEIRKMFKETAKCRIGLGTWTTSKNLGGDMALGSDWVVAARDGVSVGTQYFPDVKLSHFIPALRKALVAELGPSPNTDYYALHAKEATLQNAPESQPDRQAFLHSLTGTFGDQAPLKYDSFFRRMNTFLDRATKGSGPEATNPYIVVSDAAFSLLGSQNLTMTERGSFFSQAAWLAIGYSVGAVTGLKLALPHKRPLVFVGDGSFQETCQELSTQTRLRQDTVVFVLNNQSFYGIEQMLVHPCYYKEGSAEEPAFYNQLHTWNYSKLAEVFSTPDTPMTGFVVRNHGELEKVLELLSDTRQPVNRGPILVQVELPMKDYPAAIGYEVVSHCK